MSGILRVCTKRPLADSPAAARLKRQGGISTASSTSYRTWRRPAPSELNPSLVEPAPNEASQFTNLPVSRSSPRRRRGRERQLVPRIMLRTVGLSPLLTVVALLVGVKLGGIMGGILAVPAAAALQVIVKEGVREIGAQPDLVVVEKPRAEAEPEADGGEAEVLVGAHIAKNPSIDNGRMVPQELQRQGR